MMNDVRKIFVECWELYKRYSDIKQSDHERWNDALNECRIVLNAFSRNTAERELAKGMLITVMTYMSDISLNKAF